MKKISEHVRKLRSQTRGQVTLFLLIGAIVLIVFGFLYFSLNGIAKSEIDKQTEEITTNILKTKALRNYVTLCLDRTAKQGVDTLTRQGGYVTDLTNPIKFQGNNISHSITERLDLTENGPLFLPPKYPFEGYPKKNEDLNKVWYYGKNLLPELCDINGANAPNTDFGRFCGNSYSLKNSMQQQLQNYVQDNIPDCVNFSIFEREFKYNISSEDPEVDMTIAEDKLIFNLKYPITFYVKGFKPKTNFLDFQTSEKIRLKKVYDFVSWLIEEDTTKLGFDINQDINKSPYYFYGLEMLKTKVGNKDLFIVKDVQSIVKNKPLTFNILRSNRYPVLQIVSDKNILKGGSFDTNKLEAFDPDEEDNFKFSFILNGNKISDLSNIQNVGSNNLTISVNDSGGLMDFQSIKLNVYDSSFISTSIVYSPECNYNEDPVCCNPNNLSKDKNSIRSVTKELICNQKNVTKKIINKTCENNEIITFEFIKKCGECEKCVVGELECEPLGLDETCKTETQSDGRIFEYTCDNDLCDQQKPRECDVNKGNECDSTTTCGTTDFVNHCESLDNQIWIKYVGDTTQDVCDTITCKCIPVEPDKIETCNSECGGCDEDYEAIGGNPYFCTQCNSNTNCESININDDEECSPGYVCTNGFCQ